MLLTLWGTKLLTKEEIASAAISRLGGWIAHNGKKRPTNFTKERVEILLRNGRMIAINEHPSTWWHWRRDEDPELNIVAYRIIK